MLSLAVQKMKRHPLAKVQFPNEDKMAGFAGQIQVCEPDIDDVIGFMDGLCMRGLQGIFPRFEKRLPG